MHKCPYCGTTWENGLKLGGHMTWCKKNPSADKLRSAHSQHLIGKPLSLKHREKISAVIRKKVELGEWHLSFSRARHYKYKEENFHGSWEVKFAKYLDEKKHVWRRPKEKFPYQYKSRTGKLKSSYYTPDFYLEDKAQYIEVKGYPTARDLAKWAAFPLKLRVYTGKELKLLGIIGSYKKLSLAITKKYN